jgi:hypothetical protein
MPSVAFVGPPPSLFSTGALPPVTASGAAPETLMLPRWDLRHAGAYAQTRSASSAFWSSRMTSSAASDCSTGTARARRRWLMSSASSKAGR